MILILVLTTVVVVGLAAIALAEPHRTPYVGAWSDDAERRQLRVREGETVSGWW